MSWWVISHPVVARRCVSALLWTETSFWVLGNPDWFGSVLLLILCLLKLLFIIHAVRSVLVLSCFCLFVFSQAFSALIFYHLLFFCFCLTQKFGKGLYIFRLFVAGPALDLIRRIIHTNDSGCHARCSTAANWDRTFHHDGKWNSLRKSVNVISFENNQFWRKRDWEEIDPTICDYRDVGFPFGNFPTGQRRLHHLPSVE